jgi:hypothetical protein
MLAETARRLHTKLILPEHYYVANAVGAIAGSVMITEEILIYPHLSSTMMDIAGYFVQARDDRKEFEELEDALQYARQYGEERALSAALRSGANNPQVKVDISEDGMDTYRVKAVAIGNPRIGDH